MDLKSVRSEALPVRGAATPEWTRLDQARVDRAKAAYTTRFVSRLLATDASGYGLLTDQSVKPRPGDVVLARVENVGQHKAIELPDGRRATLYAGDEILVAYGHRYAPDQYEAEVPADLGPAHLVAAGGVAARMVSAHSAMNSPTQIQPLGLVTDASGVVTLDRYAPFTVTRQNAWLGCLVPRGGARATVIGVVGTSMNSGKSTSAAAIVRGLTAAGYRVAAGKVTGTGAGGDPGLFTDSAAVRVLDFTDFGYPSTYLLSAEQVLALFEAILGELAAAGPDAIVIEVADGLFQQETQRLTSDPVFRQCVDHVVFAASDALGAVAGLSVLSARGIDVAAVSGIVTASPLAMRETRAALAVPVPSVAELASRQVAEILPIRKGLADSAGYSVDALSAG